MFCEADGITWDITLPLPRHARSDAQAQAEPLAASTADFSLGLNGPSNLQGRRLLVVEDEPLIGLDIAAALEDAGAKVEGPVGTIEMARAIVERSALDGAFLDVNLNGQGVDEIAQALTRRKIPFAFVTGTGRDGLPAAYRDAVMLSKPFGRQQAIDVAAGLLRPGGEIVRLRS
jgi:CheY-like chemotaxis protein